MNEEYGERYSHFLLSYSRYIFLLAMIRCRVSHLRVKINKQEKLYPKWAVRVRRWWNTGYRRIILFWTVTTVATLIVVLVIATDYIQWDKLNRDFLHSNEASRAILASLILVMDILIVLQVSVVLVRLKSRRHM